MKILSTRPKQTSRNLRITVETQEQISSLLPWVDPQGYPVIARFKIKNNNNNKKEDI